MRVDKVDLVPVLIGEIAARKPAVLSLTKVAPSLAERELIDDIGSTL